MCAAVLQTAEWMYDVVDPRTRTRVTGWASDQQIEQAKIPRRHCGHQVPVVGHAVEGSRTAEPPAAVRAAEARVGGAVASALLQPRQHRLPECRENDCSSVAARVTSFSPAAPWHCMITTGRPRKQREDRAPKCRYAPIIGASTACRRPYSIRMSASAAARQGNPAGSAPNACRVRFQRDFACA